MEWSTILCFVCSVLGGLTLDDIRNVVREEIQQLVPERPRTQRTSQVVTPVPPVAPHAVLPVIPQIELTSCTSWENLYETRHVERDYYFDKLFDHCVEVNGTNRFSLVKTVRNYIIKDGRNTIFRCARNNMDGRNLYLELFSLQYQLVDFTQQRQSLQLDYPRLETPPDARRR